MDPRRQRRRLQWSLTGLKKRHRAEKGTPTGDAEARPYRISPQYGEPRLTCDLRRAGACYRKRFAAETRIASRRALPQTDLPCPVSMFGITGSKVGDAVAARPCGVHRSGLKIRQQTKKNLNQRGALEIAVPVPATPTRSTRLIGAFALLACRIRIGAGGTNALYERSRPKP
jgi:hypothetical protein